MNLEMLSCRDNEIMAGAGCAIVNQVHRFAIGGREFVRQVPDVLLGFAGAHQRNRSHAMELRGTS